MKKFDFLPRKLGIVLTSRELYDDCTIKYGVCQILEKNKMSWRK